MSGARGGGERLPPVHFVSGHGVTHRHLAGLAAEQARRPVAMVEATPRDFDVSRFVGDPSRAAPLLGWRATTSLEQGMARLIGALAEQEARALYNTTNHMAVTG